MSGLDRDAPHLPRQVPIDAYGHGGFRFADMSHRGSLLCLPSGIWAWSSVLPDEITETSLARIFADAADIKFVLIGAGREGWSMPASLYRQFHDLKIQVEVSRTGSAISTYNILLGEGRPTAAALLAVA